MPDERILPQADSPSPLFVVEFADMTGKGWGRTAAILCRYFLEMRKLRDLIAVDHSGTRVAALEAFEAGNGDLKPGELVYSLNHGFELNERLTREEAFLSGAELQRVEDFLDRPSLTQLEMLDPKRVLSQPVFSRQIRDTARACIRMLREQEREVQANSIEYLAQDLDRRILALAELATEEPRQTVVQPGRRLILTMTESDLTAVFSLDQNCGSVYDLRGRVIAREGTHRLAGNKYAELAGLLDPQRRNEPVVAARLLYFTEGKAELFRNPWEIPPNEHLSYSKRLHELVRSVADGLQFGLRDGKVVSLLTRDRKPPA